MQQMQDEFISALMQGVSDEVFLLDFAQIKLISVSDSVLRAYASDWQQIEQMPLLRLLGVDAASIRMFLDTHDCIQTFVEMEQETPTSPSKLHVEQLWLKRLSFGLHEYVLVIKNDVSSKKQAIQALTESESRFQAIVSNTPGLVFQFQLDSEGLINFIYLSEGCKALLGVEAEELKRDANIFYQMINAKDRLSLKRRLKSSLLEHKLLNWEGRVWIDAWQDTKWINLRSIPRVLENNSLLDAGSMQPASAMAVQDGKNKKPGNSSINIVQWDGIMTNITQSKNEKHEIEESRKRLAEFSAHMNQIKEEERKRIAREIHDDLGGNLTAIKIGLSSMINRLKSGQNVSIAQATQLESIVDNTFEAAHRITSDLRPTTLELGIVAALEWQAMEFEKQMNIPCSFHCHQAEVAVTSDQAITLFRICQEAMSNIAKYAKAYHVNVELEVTDYDILLQIKDDGVGIEPGDLLKKNSFGLRGMQERATALGGSFFIAKAAECGTQISIRLPIDHA